MKKKRQNILLLGSYGRGNIGDDAFLLSAIQLFEGHELFINSADDNLLPLEAKEKVETIPTQKGSFLKKIKVFMSIKHVTYYGGDLWVELYGDKHPRQALYKMLLLNAACRLFRKRVHYIGCGTGELQGYSLLLARLSARLANTIVVREERSAEILSLKNIKILPDLAFTLDTSNIQLEKLGRRDKRIKVGISLLYYLPEPETSFPRALDHLTDFISSLPEDRFSVAFLPMMRPNPMARDDHWVFQQLKKRLPRRELSLLETDSVYDCLQAISQLDFLVGARLHANILGILCSVPCLGIAYRKKVERLFRQNNLNQYYVTLEEMHMLKPKFEQMLVEQDQLRYRFSEAKEKNIERAAAYRALIAEIF